MKKNQNWPDLDFASIQDTLETLHHWIQIVGKIRLKSMPWQNHSWHVPLYVTQKDLRPIPFLIKDGFFK